MASPELVPQNPGKPQEMLDIPGYNRIPKKELYTSADFARIIGKYDFEASSIISQIKKKDPRIKGQRVQIEGIKAKIAYTQDEIVLLAQYAARPKRTRRPVPLTREDTVLPEPREDKKLKTAPKKDDVLTFQVNGKEVAVPRKELYDTKDIASTIGSENIPSIMSQVSIVRKNDPSIKANYLRNRSATKVSYTEEDLKKVVLAILTRRSTNRSKTSLLAAEEHKKENLVSVTLPNGTSLDGLTKKEGAILEFFIEKARDGETVSREEVKEVYIAAGGNPNITARSVRAKIELLADKLLEVGHTIVKTAPIGKKTVYNFRQIII